MRGGVLITAALAGVMAVSISATACSRLSQATAAPDTQQGHAAERAKSLFEQFVTGKLDRSDFTPEMDKAMTPEVVKQVQPQFATLGSITGLSLESRQDSAAGTNYVYAASFSAGEHKIQIFLTHDGKVGGYRVLP